jgi:hypothetical protein
MAASLPTLVPLAPVPRVPGLGFALSFIGLAIAAAALAGAIPIQFSIATVFLFAGPHNWFEARYILGRLPARTGKLWSFFITSAGGIVGLTAAFAALPWFLTETTDPAVVGTAYAIWNTTFVLWIATLIGMRSRTNPRFDSGWVWPAACLVCAGIWLHPIALNIALVYLHPLVALWLLDRELARSRPAWQRAYRWGLLGIPVLLLGLWWHLHDAPNLAGTDQLTLAITDHAGGWVLTGVSTHFLVAAHTFLEMVHYGVWVVLMPLIGLRAWPWQLHTIPAARRNRSWARGVAGLLLIGLALVVGLWVCFLLDYSTTRQVYFTVAMLHVLAEIPFLLRMV